MIIIIIINDKLILFTFVVPGTYVPNAFSAITIMNNRPKAWGGQLFDCRLHKGPSTILIQSGVHTGNQAVFILKPVLKFVITRNIRIEDTFISYEISSEEYEVNIDNYPQGVEIILDEKPSGGLFEFSKRSLRSDTYSSES